MFLRIKNRTLSGGALYYVIFVTFVLSAIVSLFIMNRGMRFRQIRSEIRYFERVDDLNSALTLYFTEPEKYQQSSSVSMHLFEDTARQVVISRRHIGLLDLITVHAMYRGKELSKTIMAGMDPFQGDSVVLYVPDRRQAIFASGNTIINGNAVLPLKGIQRASIEGKPLQRSKPVLGNISISNPTLPVLAPWITKKIDSMLDLDSLVKYSESLGSLLRSSIDRSSTEEIQWYGSEGDYQISGIESSGPLGFVSTGTIHIRKDAYLDGSIIAAAQILVEEGFRGTVQLFAKDSIVLGPHCELNYPSILCLSNDNVNPVYVELGESCVLDGLVLVCQKNLSTAKPFLRCSRGSLIRGQVYHQGHVELLGRIHGSLYCEGFYRKTKRAYYENHLLDNELNFHKVPPHFVFIDLLNGYNNQLIDVVSFSL